jgi:hypothetical protein
VLRRALVTLVVALAWPAAAQAQNVSLFVVGTSASETDISLNVADAGTARVQISVPAGFTLNVARPVGAAVGRADLELASAAAPSGFGSSAEGDVVVADPASYAGDPRYQPCASGTHAAVWRLEPLDIPVFVDPASGPDAALGGYDLRICLGLRPGLALGSLDLDLQRTVIPPTSPGLYAWHAFVTPLTGAGAVDEGGTYEARCLVPWPSALSLHARHAGKGRYLLYGRLVLAGEPRAHATIRLLRYSPSTAGNSFTIALGEPRSTKTNGAGRFHLRVRVKRRTIFYVFWLAFPHEGCSSPTTAPGGCVSEATSPAVSPRLVLRP